MPSRVRISEVAFIFALPPTVLSLPQLTASLSTITTTTAAQSFNTTSFPVIFVASAIIDCGAPLMRDVCSTIIPDSIFLADAGNRTKGCHHKGTNTQVTTSVCTSNFTIFQIVTWSDCANMTQAAVSTVMYTVVSTLVASQKTTMALPVVTHTVSVFSTSIGSDIVTRIIWETSYTPSLIHTTGPLLPGPNLKRDIPSTPIATLAARSYDYNSCDDVPSSHDMVSNSLADVCHFVANAEDYFVSLQPISTAAYLPTWAGYLIQTLSALMELRSIVCIRVSIANILG
jgi:hypothetical protein